MSACNGRFGGSGGATCLTQNRQHHRSRPSFSELPAYLQVTKRCTSAGDSAVERRNEKKTMI